MLCSLKDKVPVDAGWKDNAVLTTRGVQSTSLGSLGDVQTSPADPNEAPPDLITYELRSKAARAPPPPYTPPQ